MLLRATQAVEAPNSASSTCNRRSQCGTPRPRVVPDRSSVVEGRFPASRDHRNDQRPNFLVAVGELLLGDIEATGSDISVSISAWAICRSVPVSCTNFGQTSDGVPRKRTRIVTRRSRRRRNLLRPRIVLQGPTFADCRCDLIPPRASQHCDRRPRTLAEQSRSTKSIDSISPTHTSLPAPKVPA